ncbi:MAG: hypothetical protein ACK5DR_21085 [Planctomyces sp.]
MKRGGCQLHQWPRRGVVLIVVLVLVVMLSLAGFGFLSAMSTEYEAVRLHGSLLQARHTMVSAESQLLWLCDQPRRRREILGGLTDNPGLFRGRSVDAVAAAGAEAGGAGQPAVSAEDGATAIAQLQSRSLLAGDDVWRFSVISVDRPVGGVPGLRFGVTTESAKLHLATVLRWEQTTPGAGRQALLRLPGVTEIIADSLLDWMDADELQRPQGAESEYYQGLGLSTRPANAVPGRLEQLLAVRGMSARLLFGSGSATAAANSAAGSGSAGSGIALGAEGGEAVLTVPQQDLTAETFATDSAESQTGTVAGAVRPLSELLTVWSAERLSQPDGTVRVNVNQADLNAIRAGLQGRVPEALIQFLVLARISGLTSTAPAGVSEQTAEAITLPPGAVATVGLRSLGELVDGMVLVPAAGNRPPTLVRSPLQSTQADSDLLFRQLTDVACTEPGPVIVGRVSLQEAPEAVLRSLPGVTPEQAASLAAQRARLQPFERRSLLWPVRAGVLTVDQWRTVLPELTDAGDVFQAELVVFRAAGGPLLRRKLIVDGASGVARRVYWRDVTEDRLEFPLSSLTSDQLSVGSGEIVVRGMSRPETL